MMGICVYQSVFMFVLTLNLESKPRPGKPKVHTQKNKIKEKIKQAHMDASDACASGGNSFIFLEAQSHMLARMNLVIIST